MRQYSFLTHFMQFVLGRLLCSSSAEEFMLPGGMSFVDVILIILIIRMDIVTCRSLSFTRIIIVINYLFCGSLGIVYRQMIRSGAHCRFGKLKQWKAVAATGRNFPFWIPLIEFSSYGTRKGEVSNWFQFNYFNYIISSHSLCLPVPAKVGPLLLGINSAFYCLSVWLPVYWMAAMCSLVVDGDGW